jgi:hypothetical protein
LMSAGALAGLLARDAQLATELAATAAREARAAGADAVLLPSWTPVAAVDAVRQAAGVFAGRMLATYGTVPGGRELAAALRGALARAGVDLVAARVRSLRPDGERWVALGDDGPLARARAVVVAIGDGAGGGVRKQGRILVEPDVGGELVAGGAPVRQASAAWGPAADAYLPRGLFERDGPRSVGVAVDERLRPAGGPAGLFLAGAMAVPASGSSDGLGWALASALRAAQGVLELLDGRRQAAGGRE